MQSDKLIDIVRVIALFDCAACSNGQEVHSAR